MATEAEPENGTPRELEELSTARLPADMPPADPADVEIEPPEVGEVATRAAEEPVALSRPPRVFRPPLPDALPLAPPRPRARHTLLWVVNVVTFCIAAVSLTINVGLLRILAERGMELRGLIDQSLATIDGLSTESIDFNFPVSQTIDFEGDIPFEQDITFPVKTSVRVNTVISVPVDLGMLGTMTVRVPIDTTIPVDTEVPVHVSQTIHVKTKVPIEMNVPVHLEVGKPPFSAWISSARELVMRLRKLTDVPGLP